MTKTPVVVIGGGFAGLSAAVCLADAGRRVIVAEEAPRLGGRASAFTDPETGERVDNGQHVLFGCYHETYRFLKRIGTEGLAPLDRRLTAAMGGNDGRVHVLSCPALPAPWHLVAGILKWPATPWRDRLSALKMASVIADVRRAGAGAVARRTPADQTVSGWLAANGQTAELCRWLWRPLAIAALNQSPDVAAAAPFVRVLGELFGRGVNDSAIGVPKVPLDELYATPAVRFVEARGGLVLTKAPARIATASTGEITGVHIGETTTATSTVISAVPWHAFARIWDGQPPAALKALDERAARMDSLPIVTVNFWFDRPVLPHRFLGLVDGPMHWAFDKSAIFGAAAGHVSVVSSGATAIAQLDRQTLVDMAKQQLDRTLPVVRSAQVLRASVVRERRSTFSLAPGAPPRPATATALPGFFLAGDWIDTGLPGTIESAVMSGRWAAEAVLRQ